MKTTTQPPQHQEPISLQLQYCWPSILLLLAYRYIKVHTQTRIQITKLIFAADICIFVDIRCHSMPFDGIDV